MQTINSTSRCPLRAAGSFAMLALLATAVAACSDPFALKAQYANQPFAYTLYGISGAGPANAPAALDLASASAVRVDGSLSFDVAFDFDGKGKIVILPQKLVGAAVSGARAVALQRISGGYDAILLAPSKGWLTDSTLAVLPGETVGVKLTSASCAYQLSSDLYAKVVVDSVKAGGLIFGRGVMNPNCGFKSFETGIPTK